MYILKVGMAQKIENALNEVICVHKSLIYSLFRRKNKNYLCVYAEKAVGLSTAIFFSMKNLKKVFSL